MRKITFIIAAIVLAIFSSCQQKKETLKSYDEPTARKPFTVPADSLSSKRIMFAQYDAMIPNCGYNIIIFIN